MYKSILYYDNQQMLFAYLYIMQDIKKDKVRRRITFY